MSHLFFLFSANSSRDWSEIVDIDVRKGKKNQTKGGEMVDKPLLEKPVVIGNAWILDIHKLLSFLSVAQLDPKTSRDLYESSFHINVT